MNNHSHVKDYDDKQVSCKQLSSVENVFVGQFNIFSIDVWQYVTNEFNRVHIVFDCNSLCAGRSQRSTRNILRRDTEILSKLYPGKDVLTYTLE